MSETDEELASKVPEVRQKFLNQFEENITKEVYDVCDVDRIQNDDRYVECFLLHQKRNVDKAVTMIDSSLKFRKELDLNNLTEKSFPRAMHEMGAMYYHSTDKDGTKILYLQVSKTKKDPENQQLIKKFVSWWIDKHFLQNIGEPIVVLFDMTNAGISNMDIDLVKFQIGCFSTYYPALLKYMLIYDMPWILNTIWKVIKNLLTAEQQKHVLMVKPSEIQQYIPAEKLWAHMGGQDKFEYQYIPSEDSGIDIPNGDANDDEFDSQNPGSAGGVRKRVTFAEKNRTLYTSFDGETIEEETTPPLSPKDKMKPSQVKTKLSVKSKQREEDIFVGAFAAISPSEHFTFSPEEGEKEHADLLTIANISDQQIAFKVKTTSPDGYRVRPSTGLIKPQNAAEINIFLQAGHDMTQVPKDRFLVMGMKVDNNITSANQLASVWKTATKDTASYMDHRLSCQITTEAGESPTQEVSEIVALKEVITKLNSQVEHLMKSQRRVDRRVTCLFVFQIMVAITVGLFITVIVVLSLLDIDINPFSSKYTSACTPWRYQ